MKKQTIFSTTSIGEADHVMRVVKAIHWPTAAIGVAVVEDRGRFKVVSLAILPKSVIRDQSKTAHAAAKSRQILRKK